MPIVNMPYHPVPIFEGAFVRDGETRIYPVRGEIEHQGGTRWAGNFQPTTEFPRVKFPSVGWTLRIGGLGELRVTFTESKGNDIGVWYFFEGAVVQPDAGESSAPHTERPEATSPDDD